MKRIALLMLLCVLGTSLISGCLSDQEGPGSGALPAPIYVSKDPNACKSIKVDCSIHNTNDFHWDAFSDATGCGCKANRYY